MADYGRARKGGDDRRGGRGGYGRREGGEPGRRDDRGGYRGRDDRPRRFDDDRRGDQGRDERPRRYEGRDDRGPRRDDDRGGRGGGYRGDRPRRESDRREGGDRRREWEDRRPRRDDDRGGHRGDRGDRGPRRSDDDRPRRYENRGRDDRRGGYGDRGGRGEGRGRTHDRGGRGGYQGGDRPRRDRDDRSRRYEGRDDRGGRGGGYRGDRPRRDDRAPRRDDRGGRRDFDRRDDRRSEDRYGRDGRPRRGKDALRPVEEREAGHEGPIRLGESDRAPDLPEGLEYGFDQLDKETKAGLRSLNKQLAEAVGNRLIATAALLAEDDIEGALEQARYARRKASRVAIVREVTGVAAYGAGEWQLAMNELRAAQRLGGTRDHVAMIADCERATGHPERAIDLYREFGEDKSIDPEVRVELLIVASGARRDMGMGEAATAMLKVGALNSPKTEPWVSRLRYAYAENLLADGREDEAREWLSRAVAADEAGESGAAERLLELEGVDFDEFEDETDEDFDDDLAEDDEAGDDEATPDDAATPTVKDADDETDRRD
ncbi:hypothetical protein GCM10027447_22930 [Glycomyces halotolerans]